MHRKPWIAVLLQGFAALVLLAAPLSAQVAEKAWTVMVFINADNNLDAAGVADVNEMERIGSNEQVNVIVQLDRAEVEGTHRYYIERDDSPEMTSPSVQDLGEVDMGDWRQALDFFTWGVESFPAKRYAFVIWNHGRGWRQQADGSGESPADTVARSKGVSYDDQSGNNIRTSELKPLLEAMAGHIGRRVDLLGFDACLMQMGEVAAEVKDHVSVQVGAEHVEASDGWPYDEIIEALREKPEMDERELGRLVVELYVASYRDGSQGSEKANQSAVDLRRFDEFRHLLDAFVGETLANPHRAGDLARLMDETQAFDVYQYKDLGDYLSRVLAELPEKGLRSAGEELLRFYRDELVIANGSTGDRLSGSTGLSLWFPEIFFYDRLSEAYERLAFARESRWDEFLHGLFNAEAFAPTILGVDCDGPGREIHPGDEVEVSASIRNAGSVDGKDLKLRIDSSSHWVEGLQVEGEMKKGVRANRTRRSTVLRLRVSESAPHGAEIPVTMTLTDAAGNVYKAHGSFTVANPAPGATMFAAHGLPPVSLSGAKDRGGDERPMLLRREVYGHLFD